MIPVDGMTSSPHPVTKFTVQDLKRLFTAILIVFFAGIGITAVGAVWLYLDQVGWRTHTAISEVYLGNMERGEFRQCMQFVGTTTTIAEGPAPDSANAQIRLICAGDYTRVGKSHDLRVTYHGRIDRARAPSEQPVGMFDWGPRWNCRRRDWTMECWAVD